MYKENELDLLSEDQESLTHDTDDEYKPESGAETESDYQGSSDDEISQESFSDESNSIRRKRKKAIHGSCFKIAKRPLLKGRMRKSSESSTCSSQYVSHDGRNESEIASDNSEFEEKIIDTRESIEKVIKSRIGIKGDTGSKTSIYSKLMETYEEITNNEEEEQFLIKWRDRSYLYCTWESLQSLRLTDVKGLKRVENYIKKNENVTEIDPCELELIEGIDEESIDEYTIIESIISIRNSNDSQPSVEYLCKWKNLPYEDASWEPTLIVEKLFPQKIESFYIRSTKYIQPFEQRNLKRCLYNKDRFFYRIERDNILHQQGHLILRDYQVEGVKWLIHSCYLGNGAILADEMGLGKTVQIIKYITYIGSEFNIAGPHLVIVPLSTLDAWVKHFRAWAPHLCVISYYGNARTREVIRKHELIDENSGMIKFNVIVTTYEWVLKETDTFADFNWFSLIIDEGHRLKNESSQLYASLYSIKSFHRILMTGTPLQNSLHELWALLHFIMPATFNEPRCIEKYGEYEDQQRGYEELKTLISQFILRRTKKDVEKSLPPKIEQILRVDMTNQQKRYYRWVLTKNYTELSKETKGNLSGFLNIIMELKKCCNHVELVNHSDTATHDVTSLLNGSGKLILLDKLLCRLKENKSRVLIFSQMVTMLNIISQYLMKRGFLFQRLDGSMNEASRVKAIEHFNAPDSKDFCFLLSTKAGGLGINLVTADTVIIYDSDWNPQNDLQAQARAHRIGQTKQVKIYRLVTKSSIEETIIERAKRKMVLDHLVIQTMGTSGNGCGAGRINFNKDELSLILKFGADELFKENIQEGEQEPLQELDLEDIMKLAERGDTETNQLSLGEEFLSSFKVANFKTCQSDMEYYKESSKWEDIIPATEIEKIKNESFLKQQADMFLPPRRKNQTQRISSDSNEPSESESEFENDTNKSLKVTNVTKREILKFITEYAKHCNPLSNVNLICKTITSESQKLKSFQEIAVFIENCIELKSYKHLTINAHPIELGEVVENRKILGVIENVVDLFVKKNKSLSISEVKCKFSLPLANQKSEWNKRWNHYDDSRLLLGIYYHGLYNWKDIHSDHDLSLSTKLNNDKCRIAPSKLITQHVIQLVKIIQKSKIKPIRLCDDSPKAKKTKTRSNLKTASIPSSIPQQKKVIERKVVKVSSVVDQQSNDDELSPKYVKLLSSAKKSLAILEKVTSKNLTDNIKDLKAIGDLIYSEKAKELKLEADRIWDFVSRFTIIPYSKLRESYFEYSSNDI